jgi:heptosyltransferase-3
MLGQQGNRPPFWSMAILHHPRAQYVGKAVGHWSKWLAHRVIEILFPVLPNVPMEDIGNVRRVLLVRPNFRIGNTLMATPLIPALRQRFPDAHIDYLGGDTTSVLLAHLPVQNVYNVSRRFILQPWRFVALFARLRRIHYDVAVEGGIGSFSGTLYTYFTGARYRIGCGANGERFLNVRLPVLAGMHPYERRVAFARLLGASCPGRPVYEVGAAERSAAVAVLERCHLAADSVIQPFVAVFVGGHLEKRWAADRWIELARSLAALGARVLVCLGPEERQSESRYRRELPPAVQVLSPQPLRLFAALLSVSRLIVTPDSGPMHLAAAFGIPVIALLQSEASRTYAPREPDDRVLVRPTVAESVAVLEAHPAWPAVVAPATHSADAASGA